MLLMRFEILDAETNDSKLSLFAFGEDEDSIVAKMQEAFPNDAMSWGVVSKQSILEIL